MVISSNPQGGHEWMFERSIIPTASNFSKIVTTTGKQSSQRDKYLYTLAGNIISGTLQESYKNDNMQRGNDQEDEARKTFEFLTGLKVETVGLCYFDDDKRFGASPDGLIGDDCGLEIKTAAPHIQIERLEKGWTLSEHKQQIQGNMLVTGRKYWYRMSYCMGIKPIIEIIHRDDDFIKLLSFEIETFNNKLNDIVEKYTIR